MFSLNNYGVATGRLTADPFVYQNTDGSQKVRITLATNDNYKNADGKRSTQFLPFEAFIPADRNPGVYTMIHSGDKISIAYTVKNNNYRDKNTNEMIYGIVLQIEKISLEESAKDESVVSIKMTLYRLADKSQIVDALVEATENGKEVVVLVELRARFDEESNIEYSRKLEEAGCRVIYGLNGYKVHSKLCLLSRKTENGVSYITQIGTGNYNEKTSALYTDLSLLTGNQEIGKEAAEVFAALLKGEVVEKSNLLLVAPKCLQNRVLDMIQEEIDQVKQGKEGYIGIKINSLTDKVIINKLVEASQAGVKIELVVRGICCLIPEIKGYTENIKVVSIVGRYLEHSRIYRFGTKEREKIYIASADFMTRNTVRRVEVAAPVLDEKLKERLDWMFATMMNDDEKGKRLTETGNYADRNLNDVRLNSQEIFYAMAYSNAEKMQKKEKSEK